MGVGGQLEIEQLPAQRSEQAVWSRDGNMDLGGNANRRVVVIDPEIGPGKLKIREIVGTRGDGKRQADFATGFNGRADVARIFDVFDGDELRRIGESVAVGRSGSRGHKYSQTVGAHGQRVDDFECLGARRVVCLRSVQEIAVPEVLGAGIDGAPEVQTVAVADEIAALAPLAVDVLAHVLGQGRGEGRTLFSSTILGDIDHFIAGV